VTDRENPLKTCFYIISFLLIMTFLETCFKIANTKDVSGLFSNLFSRIAVYRIVIFVAFCAFIFSILEKVLLHGTFYLFLRS